MLDRVDAAEDVDHECVEVYATTVAVEVGGEGIVE